MAQPWHCPNKENSNEHSGAAENYRCQEGNELFERLSGEAIGVDDLLEGLELHQGVHDTQHHYYVGDSSTSEANHG